MIMYPTYLIPVWRNLPSSSLDKSKSSSMPGCPFRNPNSHCHPCCSASRSPHPAAAEKEGGKGTATLPFRREAGRGGGRGGEGRVGGEGGRGGMEGGRGREAREAREKG